MQHLHDFMCPRVAPAGTHLRDDPGQLLRYPPKMAYVCDFERDRVVHQAVNAKTRALTLVESATDPESLAALQARAGRKAFRSVDLIERMRAAGVRWFAGNMEDGAPFSPDLYFGQPANIVQYNRRRGDPYGVLWGLPTYFEPSRRLGLVMDPSELDDPRPFADKIPKAVWRGTTTGEHWASPFGFEKLQIHWGDAGGLQARDLWSPRVRAVAMSLEHPDRLDCRFVIRRRAFKKLGEDDLANPAFSPERARRWLLRFKYQLCLPGNDVATQLYWVLATNSIAFKLQSDFEVLPDYFLRPWVHYVPVAADLHDLQDKIAYCESNPDVCRALIERANAVYETIIDPAPWHEAEGKVLDRLGLMGRERAG